MSYQQSQQKKDLAAVVPKLNTNDEFIGGGEKGASEPKKVVVRDSPEKWWAFPQFVPLGSAVLVVDGWIAKVKVSPVVSNPTITINGKKFEGTREAKITIDPSGGIQKITASVTSGKKGGLQSLIFEADASIDPKSHSTRYGSTFVYYEYPSSINNAFSQGKTIEQLRQLVNAKDTQNVYLTVRDGIFEDLQPGYDYRATGNILSIPGRNENEAKVITTHEECHAIHEKFEKENNAAALNKIEDAYDKLNESYKRRIDIDFRDDVFENIHLWALPMFMNDVMNKLFADGQYPGIRFYAGHPWDDKYELFASATTILRLFPEQFFDKLAHYERFSAAWPGIADEAKDIARDIVLAWGKKAAFPDMVYKKLGLEKP